MNGEVFFLKSLWLYAIPLVWIVFFVFRRKVASPTQPDSAQLRFPDDQRLEQFEDKPRIRALWAFYALIISLLFVAIAQPYTLTQTQVKNESSKRFTLVVDVSPSMAIKDYTAADGERKSRMKMLKQSLGSMLKRRQNDSFSLIAFADEAARLAPVTHDANVIYQQMLRLQPGLLGQGTAIGDALALAAKTLIDEPQEQRAVVLFSDGHNTAGVLSPEEGLAFSHAQGLKIYTVMISPDPNAEAIDDDPTLQEIAALTGGAYFEAIQSAELNAALKTIEQMERGEIKQFQHSTQVSQSKYVLYGAVGLLGLMWILQLLTGFWVWISQKRESHAAA